MKTIVGLLTGSLGILAEAAHSGLDLVAALMTYIAVRISGRPADRTHLYGHGKVENLSALIETLLLFVTCGWIIREAIHRLFFHKVEVEVTFWSFAVMAISIVVDISRSRMLARTAKKYNSQALEADALHFETDVWSSSVVIARPGCVKLGEWAPSFGWLREADAVAALGVSALVIWVCWQLGQAHDRCAGGFGAGGHGRADPGRGFGSPRREGLPPHSRALLRADAVHRSARAGGRQADAVRGARADRDHRGRDPGNRAATPMSQCILSRIESFKPLIAASGALDPIVEHRGVPLRCGIAAQLFDGEAHLAAPVRILPGAAGQVLLVHFLGQILLVDGQQLRRRHGQEADDGVVQFAGQFRVVRRRARQVSAHQLQLEQHVEHLLLLRLRAAPVCARCTSSSMMPAARRALMSAPTQKPASVGRSCVVEETSACRGYSSLRRNSPRSFFSK